MFSTGKDDWETPSDFFQELDSEFHFTLDACATDGNAKCSNYFTPEQDGLLQNWRGRTVFCNPPYSKKLQDAFVKKCYEESLSPETTVVALLPARTDTARFHNYILGKAEIRFIRGRLQFEISGQKVLDKHGRATPAPFPSMVVIWR